MSLEPAVAALAGMVVLQEFLSPVQWLAMACVIVASVGATRSGTPLDRAGAGLSTAGHRPGGRSQQMSHDG